MSLNGLDDNAVAQAHHNALADPGGWFLLKYVSRDTVQLLSRGNGGVAEAKGAVEQYVEKSPLFGMLQYRRKRVLLKYVPEGTSRLLQVRLSVQFQSILDAFPHDTVFSFTTAAELIESALGQCTMLLPTIGGNTKSSDSSLRQRRLNEISEDTEDHSMPFKREEPRFARVEPIEDQPILDVTETSTLPPSAVRAKALLAKRREERQAASQSSITLPLQSHPVNASTLHIEPRVAASEQPRSYSSLSQLRPREEIDYSRGSENPAMSDERPSIVHHSRHLSENESASISQWNEQVTAFALPASKPPKKKLAPRPHVETNTRPKTANTYEENLPSRPVANLPQTVRVSNRPRDSTIIRPGSQQSSRSVPARFNPTPNSLPPPLPEFTPLQPFFHRPESRKAGSVTSSTMPDAANASPEKLRLMRALQHRKRTQLLTQRSASAQPNLTIYEDDFPMGTRPSELLVPAAPLPPTIREEPAKDSTTLKSAHESSTASPTSIATISENHSTRPSSFAEDHAAQGSQKSASHDTNSSSTPKATAINSRAETKKHTSWYDSAPDLNIEEDKQEHIKIDKSLRGKASAGLENDKSHVDGVQSRQDRSTLSWLASDSQLDVLQSVVQSMNVPEDHSKRNHLSVDSLAAPRTECSSVISDDDAFVDDLRKATIHEATSMSVQRPTFTPTMRTVSHDRSRATTLSGSNLTPKSSRSGRDVKYNSPGGESDRSLSTALPQLPLETDVEPAVVSLTKKTTLSHGISERIKALEDSSRKDTNASLAPPELKSARSSLSTMIKRNSFISQFPVFNGSTEKTTSKDNGQPASSNSEVSKPNRPWVERQTSGTESTTTKTHEENVSNGTITPRDNKRQQDRFSNLFSEHTRSTSTNTYSYLPDLRNHAMENASLASDKKRFSFASYRSGSTARSNGRWVQPEPMTSKVSLSTAENRYPRTAGSEASSVNGEKQASRASRLMKRVSGFGGRFSGKGQQLSTNREEFRPDPIMEQNEAVTVARSESIAESTMQMIDVGDVNVQFPETLLWKRRYLRIDDQGYLVFSAPTDSQNIRATSRKFHLADVQEPCLPDIEREEIAWSVLLDLRDGNCVQCACGSKQAQDQVLKMLLDAHNAYHSLYPESLA